MNRIKVLILIIIFYSAGIFYGSIYTLTHLEIDSVNELDKGIITIKFLGQDFDYEYEYNEILGR